MKPILWEASAGALDALLATRQFVFADLYTITLPDGLSTVTQPLRYTTADIDVGYGGNTWLHGGPLVGSGGATGSRPTGHWKLGLDVDTWDVVIVPRAYDPVSDTAFPDNIGGIPWQAAVRAGLLDNAVITVDRAFAPVWPAWPVNAPFTPAGVLNIFTGITGGVDFSRTQVALSIDSYLVLLSIAMPRNLYGAACKRNLFDIGCTLNRASFAVTGTVAALPERNIIQTYVTPPGGSSGTFTLGRVGMTSGRNAGFSRPIARWTPPADGAPGQMALYSPFPFSIAAGDPLVAWPGCDKSVGSCDAFGNGLNFGGERFIPAPSVAVGL